MFTIVISKVFALLGAIVAGASWAISWATTPKAPGAPKARRRWGQPWWARKKRPKDPLTGEEIPVKAKPGKELEQRFGDACRKFSLYPQGRQNPRLVLPKDPQAYWNSNSTHPVCDARLTFFGISVVAECKECSEERYGFRRMSDKERLNLEANERAGGLSVVFFLHRWEGGVRLFALSWLNWKALEKRGLEIKRTTFPLVDEGRPAGLREIPLLVTVSQEGLDFEIDPDGLFSFLASCCAHYLSWNLSKITEVVPNAA